MNLYLLALIVVVNLAIWTHFDAARLRDSHHVGVGPKGIPPHSWASMVLLMPLAFPYYLSARSEASNAPRRDSPPPLFVARDLNVWGYLGGIVFFALAVYLVFTGQTMFGALAGVGMAASLFGGRTARQDKSGGKSFDLGKAAWDMSGFKPVPEDDFDDDVDGDGLAVPVVSAPRPEVPSAGGVDVFSPLAEDNRSAPQPAPRPMPPTPPPAQAGPQWSEPVSGVFDPDVVADAAPPVAKAISEDTVDDDVWDPVRADQEAQRADQLRTAEPAVASPVADAPQPPAPVSPSAPPAPSSSTDDELAPFQLGSEDEVAEAPASVAESDDEDLSHLLPLPPMVTGERRQAVAGRSAPSGAGAESGTRSPQQAPAQAARRPSSSAHPPARPASGSSPEPTATSGAMAPYAYAGATKSSRPPAVLLWFAGIAVLLALAWGYSKSSEAPEEPEAPPDAVETVVQQPPPEVEEAARAAEEAMRLRMNEWISTYDSVMRPLASLVEQIDFGELRTGACLELQRQAKTANRSLSSSPDEEVELLLRPAFEAFVSASVACSAGKEQAWSIHLLQAKDHTHETQVLLDEKYRYVGPYELEQEEALGHSRSLESISGRYLAGELYEDE